MRILLVGPVPPELGSRNHGGVARHVWDLAKALHQRGHEVEVLALGRYYRKTRIIDGIVVHGLSFHVLRRLPYLLCRWQAFIREANEFRGWLDRLYILYALLRLSPVIDRPYDVVHTHGYGHKVAIACSLFKETVPTVLTVHSYTSIQFGSGTRRQKIKQYNSINEEVDSLIHVSHADREKGCEFGVEWRCQDYVVHNAVDVSEVKLNEGKREGICFVGSLINRKGLDILVEAREKCSDIGSLHIIGKGPLSEMVEKESEQNSSIHAMGYLEKKKVLQQMRHSNALVVPSRSESFGLVYLEALLVGTPVVGYHRTLKEFISVLGLTKEESRYIYPYDAGNESVSRLAELIEQAVVTRRNDTNGRIARGLIQKIRRHFSWDRIIPELELIYEQVANKSAMAGERE